MFLFRFSYMVSLRPFNHRCTHYAGKILSLSFIQWCSSDKYLMTNIYVDEIKLMLAYGSKCARFSDIFTVIFRAQSRACPRKAVAQQEQRGRRNKHRTPGHHRLRHRGMERHRYTGPEIIVPYSYYSIRTSVNLCKKTFNNSSKQWASRTQILSP